MQKTRHQFFPVNKKTPEHLESTIKVFSEHEAEINSQEHQLSSNSVLGVLRNNLEAVGFRIESDKKKEGRIKMPVLYGENSQIIKYFDVDGYHEDSNTVLEVEAGRGFLNNQFLKDFFEACIMVDVDYCVIAVRNFYLKSNDFEKVKAFFDSMYASDRMKIPLQGLLLIGY